MKQKRARAITLQGAIEESNIAIAIWEKLPI